MIAERTHGLAVTLASSLEKIGYKLLTKSYFDTIQLDLGDLADSIHRECIDNEINFNYKGSVVTIALDETTSVEDIQLLNKIFSKVKGIPADRPILTIVRLKRLSLQIYNVLLLTLHIQYLTHTIQNMRCSVISSRWKRKIFLFAIL